MDAYFRELIARRRSEPGEDMLTAMMGAEGSGEGDRLSDDELSAMCALLLFAGHETTTNSIANATLALLRRPDDLARLRAEPDLLARGVEELLRFDGPIKVINRWVVDETEIRGRTISPGRAGAPRAGRGEPRPGEVRRPGLGWTSTAARTRTSRSARASTPVSARSSRGWRPGSPSGGSSSRLPGLALAAEPRWKPRWRRGRMEALEVTV